MASQLRWILLGLGILLVAGLWWWERRRPVVGRVDDLALRGAERFEPRLEVEPGSPGPAASTLGAEPGYRTRDDRLVPHGDPPLLTIEDLPSDTDSVVLAPTALEDEPATTSVAAETDLRRAAAEPWPERGSASTDAPEALEDAPVEDSAAQGASELAPRQQRIVAIRLVGDHEQRIDGTELKNALAAEGLQFGRYSIFHRVLPSGRPVYSVASLVEPGSFEEELMTQVRFPGISLFAVYPGPLPAPQAFDELLAAARRLADRLGGTLQDDTGSSLTGQRVLSIREELVHFEHLVGLSRSRPAV